MIYRDDTDFVTPKMKLDLPDGNLCSFSSGVNFEVAAACSLSRGVLCFFLMAFLVLKPSKASLQASENHWTHWKSSDSFLKVRFGGLMMSNKNIP